MRIKIEIDEKCREPEVIILTDKITDEVNEIMRRLSEGRPEVIAGFKDETLEILEKGDILRIYSQSGKVIYWLDGAFSYGRNSLLRNIYSHLFLHLAVPVSSHAKAYSTDESKA